MKKMRTQINQRTAEHLTFSCTFSSQSSLTALADKPKSILFGVQSSPNVKDSGKIVAGGCKQCVPAPDVTYFKLSEHWVIIDAGEENPHGISAIVEVGDAGSVQIAGQLVDVCLQLGKGCKRHISVLNIAILRTFSPFIETCIHVN